MRISESFFLDKEPSESGLSLGRTHSLERLQQQEISEATLQQQQNKADSIRRSLALSRTSQQYSRETPITTFQTRWSSFAGKRVRKEPSLVQYLAEDEGIMDPKTLLEFWDDDDHERMLGSHGHLLVPIHPHSLAHSAWSSVVGVTLVICILVDPVGFAFSHHLDADWFSGFDVFFSVIFLLDIVFLFASGYEDAEGHVEMRARRVAKRYAWGWLAIDFLAALPKVVFRHIPYFTLLKAHRLLGVGLRSMKLSRVAAALKRLHLETDIKISPWTMKCMIWFGGVMVWFHFAACATAWVWVESGDDEFRLIDVNGIDDIELYRERKCQNDPSCQARYYLRAFRTAIGYLIGHGQYSGFSWREELVVVIFCLTGSVLWKSFMAMLLHTLLQKRADATKHYRIENQLNQYMGNKQTPLDLRFRVRMYLDQAWDKLGGTTEHDVLGGISKGLRGKIRAQATENYLRSIPFFNNGPPGFIFRVGQIMYCEVFVPDDTIMRTGEVGKEMYIIAEGHVEVLDEFGEVLAVLGVGSYFGENALEENSVRTVNIRAISEGLLYVIQARQLDQIYDRFPKMKKAMLDHTAQMGRPRQLNPAASIGSMGSFRFPGANDSQDFSIGQGLGIPSSRGSLEMTRNSIRTSSEGDSLRPESPKNSDWTSPSASKDTTPNRKRIFMKYFT